MRKLFITEMRKELVDWPKGATVKSIEVMDQGNFPFLPDGWQDLWIYGEHNGLSIIRGWAFPCHCVLVIQEVEI